MTRWYTHAAALAVLLGATWAAQAQLDCPSPVGAARMPEPMSYTPKKPPPDVVPGPITPEIAPMGPPPELSLPANHLGAFQTEHYPTEEAFFAAAGYQGLQRYRLPRLGIVFREVTRNPANPPDLSPLQFYPTLPASARPVLQDLANLQPDRNPGVRATVGYLLGNQSFEVSGWYVEGDSPSLTTNGRGNLTVPFGTVSPRIPLGFEGNNNLWVNADRVVTSHNSQTGSVEFNYRNWNSGINHIELIMGLRFAHAQERVGIFTNDEQFVLDARGFLDPRRAATYAVTSRNNIFAFQFGGEYASNVPIPVLQKFLWFTLLGKVGVGPNFIDRTFNLRRGDGFLGFDTTRNEVQFGQIYELAASLDFHILERVRVKAGYMALWLGGTSTAGGDINFNLSAPAANPPNNAVQFFHGPMLEMQFLF